MKNVSILGSTGSVGSSTLNLIERRREHFRVIGLAAGKSIPTLLEQAKKFRPKIVCLGRREEAAEFRKLLKDRSVRVTFGPEGAEEIAGFEENDIVVSAITGIDGLRPTLAAVEAGKKIALANKESMVVAGQLIQKKAARSRARIIPVDSEHSGVFQCLAKEQKRSILKVILTASGGPFFKTPLSRMREKTLEETLNHPRWKMGKKVTVDSATLMNKGLELIEARWLFNLSPGQLDVLIHPQSVVHSLVELKGGSVLAQLSLTDMRIPILYALTYPQREDSFLPALELDKVGKLEFFKVDEGRFPLFALARKALEEGDSFPVALNAANEVVVGAFLRGEIGFAEIAGLVRRVVECHHKKKAESLADIFEVDGDTRRQTWNLLKQRS
jgi:1-deoxy-D-xylulose-5-phosphate reductoisomerase